MKTSSIEKRDFVSSADQNLITMKIFLLPALLYSISVPGYRSSTFAVVPTDSSIIVHVLDGNTMEWPKTKFDTDNETKMQYAADNNDKTLFLALIVAGKEMQKKILAHGMNLYIDTKGRKRESKGIEFPVSAGSDPVNALSTMKLFGFTTLPSFVQSSTTEGTANIVALWDSLNVLHIEYNIPITLLGNTDELKNRKISIGWKPKEETGEEIKDNKTSGQSYTTATIVGVPAGTRPGNTNTNRNAGPNRDAVSSVPQSNRTQSFWTSHTLIF